MTNDDPRIGLRFGCYAGATYLLVAIFFAASAAKSDFPGGETWIPLGILDTPMDLLLFPVINRIPLERLHRVSFLPGVWGDAGFLFSLLYFVVLGTAFWFLLGWLFGRITRRLRYRC